MNVYRDAVLVRSKNSLHFVFAEGVQEIGEAKGSILQYPGTISTERVASVYDMPVVRETCEKIANTLQ